MHHSRAYSYDDQNGGHSGSHIPTHQSQFPGATPQYVRGYQQPQGSGQYYVQAGGNADITQPDPYLRSMTPMASPTHHYSSSGQQRYYQSSGGGGSSSQMQQPMYPAQTPYYNQYPRSQTPGIHPPEITGSIFESAVPASTFYCTVLKKPRAAARPPIHWPTANLARVARLIALGGKVSV
ncbi:hypothetical protein D9615_004741 [Tricholomella constricta]|uniref:Uncharacterized protein n=1 Tax=Tricholomella constricta TaxID=117010 RepID=A0A8H5HC62_9AGAR|nr:hypothetical protein D9615_004741 [Tricholomella constricta]